jgi:hypothetical protein
LVSQIFFQRNALDAMISEPTKVQDPMFVDDPSGNKQSVKAAGMAPNFVEKKVSLHLGVKFDPQGRS